ncbi:MAG: hypothetical protein A3K61_03430 [Thaumarchaeota archaeon RBG_16_49_8]|nr:MAG: hypothetical protein A3K61_03430 [Thaumarchaeota archaeon RBG_16_49_8]
MGKNQDREYHIADPLLAHGIAKNPSNNSFVSEDELRLKFRGSLDSSAAEVCLSFIQQAPEKELSEHVWENYL